MDEAEFERWRACGRCIFWQPAVPNGVPHCRKSISDESPLCIAKHWCGEFHPNSKTRTAIEEERIEDPRMWPPGPPSSNHLFLTNATKSIDKECDRCESSDISLIEKSTDGTRVFNGFHCDGCGYDWREPV